MYIVPLVDGIAFVNHGKVALKGFDEPADVPSITRAALMEASSPAAQPPSADQ